RAVGAGSRRGGPETPDKLARTEQFATVKRNVLVASCSRVSAARKESALHGEDCLSLVMSRKSDVTPWCYAPPKSVTVRFRHSDRLGRRITSCHLCLSQ